MTGPDPSALPHRAGPRPRVVGPAPQHQVEQFGAPEAVRAVIAAAARLPGVRTIPSLRAPPGTVGFALDPEAVSSDPDAVLMGTEFAHVHPLPEGGLHMVLPPDVRDVAIAKGWAEPHPLAGRPGVSARTVLVYAPRDAGEADVVLHLITAARAHAQAPRSALG